MPRPKLRLEIQTSVGFVFVENIFLHFSELDMTKTFDQSKTSSMVNKKKSNSFETEFRPVFRVKPQ